MKTELYMRSLLQQRLMREEIKAIQVQMMGLQPRQGQVLEEMINLFHETEMLASAPAQDLLSEA